MCVFLRKTIKYKYTCRDTKPITDHKLQLLSAFGSLYRVPIQNCLSVCLIPCHAHGRGQGHETRDANMKQLRAESRLELFFRMDATLTISLGAGTGMQLEDTSHRLALCRRAFLERKLAAPAREPLDNS